MDAGTSAAESNRSSSPKVNRDLSLNIRSQPRAIRQKAGEVSDTTNTNSGFTSFRGLPSKQSKSRNGCATCKKKRIKCDEVKPRCGQCQRRSVDCEGYRKDLKWLPTEDPASQQFRPGKSNTTRCSSTIRPMSSGKSSSLPITAAEPFVVIGLGLRPLCLSKPCQRSPERASSGIDIECDPSVQGSRAESTGEATSDRVPFLSSSASETLFNSWDLPSVAANEDDLDDLSDDLQQSFLDQKSGSDIIKPTSAFVSDPVNQASFSSSIPSMLELSTPDMLAVRFHRETCGILSIKNGPSENPWRTLVWPMAQTSNALHHALLALAALHGSFNEPQLKSVGMAQTTQSISALVVEMHNISLDQTLATALALALGRTWYEKTSTGWEHLKGAKKVLNDLLSKHEGRLALARTSAKSAQQLKFLFNTYVYLYSIGRLTSCEAHDDPHLENSIRIVGELSRDSSHEIDPMMGSATAIFPLLDKVAHLVQRVRKTTKNSLSIISEANALKAQLLEWEPPDLASLEQPEDPSVTVRDVLLTAEAYRRALLLHLELAVIELSSESPEEQAMAILTILATTPMSSRTLIVHIFPLLIASCEVTAPDDREWVTGRWEAMIRRLGILNVISCWEVVKEVWDRRDKWSAAQAQRVPGILPQPVSFHYSPPSQDSSFTDTVGSAVATGLSRSRRQIHLSMLGEKTEYTVRGHLHWLSVMSDWQWEIFL